MKLQNVTLCVLGTMKVNGVVKPWIKTTLVNPEVPSKDGKPVLGQNVRRLMTVGEIAAEGKMSRNKAAEERKLRPILWLRAFGEEKKEKAKAA